MICAFPCHQGDIGSLLNLLEWINQLGGCKGHRALLVADAKTDYKQCARARELLKTSFSEVRCITNGKSVTGWPKGPNSLFWAAATYIGCGWQVPWLFMETDAVPLKEGWLDAIAKEYASIKHPFMGDVYHGLAANSGMPVRAVSGVAVYPPDAYKRLELSEIEAWDMTNREYLLANTHATGLIKHFYGTSSIPPVFVSEKTPQTPPHAFTPDQIRKEAVVWHRNKDGSLIRCLRQKLVGLKKNEQLELAYICVANGGNSLALAERFLNTYSKYSAGVEHVPTVIFNGSPIPSELRAVFKGFNQFQWTNEGYDIGAYIGYSHVTDSELLLCLGESVYFHRPGWFERIADAWRRHGPGFYGVYSSNLVRQHCPTTAFACTPAFLRQHPPVRSKPDRYNFEHGKNSIWKRVQSSGGATQLVTWSGVYPPAQWRAPKNIFWTGDQSECLMRCNHTDRYDQGGSDVKRSLEAGANMNVTSAPGFLKFPTLFPVRRLVHP